MTTIERAVVPTEDDSAAASSLVKVLNAAEESHALVSPSASVILPGTILTILSQVAELLAAGRAVAIVPVDTELTTREAADLLGISRPTLIKLLEQNEIPYTRPHSSRRIRLDEVLAFKERRTRKRRALLAEMTADAMDSGLYGLASNENELS